MLRLIFPLAAVTLLAGCAAPRVGVADLDLLAAQAPEEAVSSVLGVEAFAACFQERADFLPYSRFVGTPEHWRYTLSGYGAAYESVTIRPAATGSVAEVRLGGYDDRWARSFERDRGVALRACATPPTVT
jgi:hypothetical protein